MDKRKNNIRVPYGLAVHGKEEEKRVLKVLREKRTILGQETADFEKSIAKLFGKKYGVMVNSGSSANLLAIELLKLPEGSEIVTPVLTFSTTVSPLIIKKLIPVFIDVEEGSYLIDLDQIERSITKRTKALMIPLLLGNVPDLEKLSKIAKKHKLAVILDSCDTLGAVYKGKKVGHYADICSTSFYGSHIITAAGNGGMLLMNSSRLRDRAKILRGWGRGSAVYNESEDIDTRFKTKLGKVPYDVKFIFSEIGYNFLPMELGSAFGNAQLKKLTKFKKIRMDNFKHLLIFFKNYQRYFILPKQNLNVQTQWLSFPLTIKKNAPFTRLELVRFLENANIQTRPIMTGIITKQPGFRSLMNKQKLKKFPIAEEVTERGFVIGCHHGLTDAHINKIKKVFESFLNKF